MSTVHETPELETYECSECDTEYDAGEAVNGSFCSWGCYYRKKGRAALQQIKHDHRICATCFRPIKTVLEPEERHPDCVVGWQFPTENTVHAIDEFWRDEVSTLLDEDSPDAPARTDLDVGRNDRVERTRWACSCGAVDSGHRYEELEEVEPAKRLTNAAVTAARLSREDSIGGTFERERYTAAVRAHWPDTDWEHILGYALYGPYHADDADREDVDADAYLDTDPANVSDE